MWSSTFIDPFAAFTRRRFSAGIWGQGWMRRVFKRFKKTAAKAATSRPTCQAETSCSFRLDPLDLKTPPTQGHPAK